MAQIPGLAQSPAALAPAYRADRILIKPKPGISRATLAGLHAAHNSRVLRTFDRIGGLQILQVPAGETAPGLVAKYQRSGLVEFAEPDYLAHTAATTPNDPRYLDHTLWGLDKISAPAGWDVLTSASNIVVAVLDTGVRDTHQDLAANMWISPYDGGHGLNALVVTNPPADDNGHGTLVAGVLGAVGNNATGVVGVAWRVQIMACKCFNYLGQGNDSDIITCIDYAQTNGARLINASWGVTNSLAVSNALAAARDAGIIVIAACGNNATNIDLNPSYPTGFHLDNVVSVAYTTKTDTLATASNYGATSVHLAAPGEQIYSTFAATDNSYFPNSGTSFAAPYVTGALALMLVKYPAETYQEIIARLLAATDPLPSLAGKCITGGRLNLRNALSPPIRLTPIPGAAGDPFTLRLSSSPNRTCVIERSSTLTDWFPVFTNTTATTGAFDFTDTDSTNLPYQFYRGVATP